MARLPPWLLVVVALPGCALPLARGRADRPAWIARYGGSEHGPLRDRAVRALARLNLGDGARPRVEVLAADGLDAWAWPDGSIVVTRGLVDRVEEPELVAALAHEIGHLVLGGHLAGGRDLARFGRADDERAADRVAQVLLTRSGLTHDALRGLLGALHAHAPPASDQRARLMGRLEALGASL